MATKDTSDDEEFVHCFECGAEIRRDAEICNECGVRQQGVSNPTTTGNGPQTGEVTDNQNTSSSTDYLEQYSVFQWIIAIVVGLISFPIGLIVPAYLFYKASNGTGKEQSGLEAWTAILWGIIGIIAVEIGGDTAAKVLWAIFGLAIALLLAVVVAG